MIITAGKRSFQELNNEIRGMLLSEDMIRVEDVNGQRYIGAALDKGKTIEIHGTPGNDMGAYLNGGSIEVYGNGQEAVGNTMGGGSVTIHGHVGDTLGLKSGNPYEGVSRAFARSGHRRRRRRIPRRIYGRRNTHSPRSRQFGKAADCRAALCHGYARRQNIHTRRGAAGEYIGAYNRRKGA